MPFFDSVGLAGYSNILPIPIHILVGVTEDIERLIRNFWWKGSGEVLLDWDKVVRPREKGGLAIRNMATRIRLWFANGYRDFLWRGKRFRLESFKVGMGSM